MAATSFVQQAVAKTFGVNKVAKVREDTPRKTRTKRSGPSNANEMRPQTTLRDATARRDKTEKPCVESRVKNEEERTKNAQSWTRD